MHKVTFMILKIKAADSSKVSKFLPGVQCHIRKTTLFIKTKVVPFLSAMKVCFTLYELHNYIRCHGSVTHMTNNTFYFLCFPS